MKNTDEVLPERALLQMIQRLQAIQLHCGTDRRTDRNQTGRQSRVKPSDEAVKDAALSFIRTADT